MDVHIPQTLAVVGLAVALLTTGCTGSTGTPAGRSHHPTRLDEDRLRLALLDLNDLPSGWAADSARAAKERGIGVPQPARGPCRTLFRDATGTAETSAGARFARTRVGPFVITRTGSYDSGRAARSALEAFEKAAGRCTRFQITEGPAGEGGPVTYEAAKSSMPRLGDASVALRFTREGPGAKPLTVVADVVYARVGASTVHLAQAGLEDAATGSVEPMVRRAVKKLREVVAERTPRPTGSFPGVTELRAAPYARSYE